MFQPGIQSQRLAALFLLGCLLFNYPILQLFSTSSKIGGIPVLYLYIFSAWGALITLIALVVHARTTSARTVDK